MEIPNPYGYTGYELVDIDNNGYLDFAFQGKGRSAILMDKDFKYTVVYTGQAYVDDNQYYPKYWFPLTRNAYPAGAPLQYQERGTEGSSICECTTDRGWIVTEMGGC